MRNSGKALSVIMQVLVVLFLWVASSEATVYTLNDRALNRNTSATVDDATASTGLYSFKVDGTELMWQQWFWYRVGATGGEASLETLGAPTEVVSTATGVTLTYTKAGEFTIKVQYQLTPYTVGAYRADLKKTVTITNIAAQPLDFHLFEYSDYDITQLATPADKVEVVGNRVYQTGPQTYADEGITLVHDTVPSPTSFDFDNNQIYLYTELKDTAPSNFPSPQTTYTTDAEADDLQFANQWDLAIPVGGSKIITITDKVYPNLPLSATKTHAGTTVNYLGSADYNISFDNLKNLYGTTLTNVKIIDYLPKDTVFTSASTGGVHDPLTNTVTWSLANIAPLANTQSVQTSATVNSVKDITNEALLVSDEAFPTRVTDLAVLGNHPPSIVSAAITSAYTETPYTYQVKASDVDAGTTFSYSLASAPTGMTINASTGVISWTPTLAQEGAHQVSVVVADNGSLKATQTYTVNVIKLNRPPVITSVAPAYAVAGQLYTYTIVASDPDGDPLNYYLESSSLPQGLTLAGNVIGWTPAATQVGTYNIGISVADAKLAKTYQYFSITVTADGANTPPVVTKPADQTTIVGGAVSLQIQATDADSNPLTYSATGLPAGLSINSTTGLISGTLLSSIPGNYLVTVTVTDGFAPVAVSFTWVVKDKTTPVITWATPAAITYGTALSSTQLNATANVAGTLTYTPAAGTVLNAGTQTLNVTFTPNDTATYNTVTKSITITVNKATAFLMLSGLNQTYTGTAKTVTATTSPTGLGYSVTYGGSATAPSAAGSYAVVATVTDPNYTGSATGTLVIAKATPTITWAAPTAVYVGTALSSTQLNATANVNGTFTYTPAAGTVMNTVGTQTLTASFAPTDSANYAAASKSVSLSVVTKQVPVITWGNPAAITYGTALSATQLNAKADVAGTFTYTPAVGTVLNAGTQSLSVVFTPTDGTTYTTATKTVSLTVNKASATVTLTGLTATYDGSAKAVTATTNPAGKAVAITYGGSASAPSAAGSYAIVATVTDPNYTGSATGTLVIAKATPTITWAAPSAVYVGTALSNTQLNATANVNGTFTYTPAAGTVMNTVGTQTLTASFTPVDTANYNTASASVSLSVVTKQVPVITWSNPAAITYGTALSATQLNAKADVAGTFTYTPAVGTVLNAGTQSLSVVFTPTDGTTYTTATKTVSLTVNKASATVTLTGLTATYDGSAKAVTATTNPPGKAVAITYGGSASAPSAAGSYAIVATVTDPNYTGSATGTLVIARATPAITWATPSSVYVGTALSSTQLNATANVNGTFTYTPAAGTVMNTVGNQTLSASFTPVDTANYNTASASVSLSVVTKQVPVITWGNPAAITYGTALSATQLNAKADVAGTFTYTPVVGTVLNAGTQSLSVVFTPTDGTTYTTATKTVSLTVNKAAATVTLSGLTATYDGSAKAVTATTNPAGKAVAITYGGSATAPSAAGSYAIVATITDPNYTGSATGTLVIAKATPAITWATPSAVYVGTALSSTQLNATANVNGTFTYTPAAGTVMNTVGIQTLSASFAPTDGTNYNTATASVNLTVSAKQVPVITWGNPAAITYGTALSATQLSATANTAGTFTYTPAVGTVLNAGTQTLSVTFTPTDGTTYTTATKTVSLTVNKAMATVTLTGLTATYDGSAKAVTATTNPAGKAVAITYGGSASAPSAAGSYAVVATVTDPNYTGSATGTLVIAKATPVITWAAPSAVYVGTALSSTQLNATANVNGTFTYTPAAGTIMNTVGNQTLSAAFTPVDTANYNTASASVSLSVVTKQVPVITWGNPAAITYGTALSATQLNAKADVAGTFTYTPAVGTVLNAGTQSLSVVFTPTDGATYTTVNKSVTLTVNKATPIITWAAPFAVYVGTALSSTQLNATANVNGTFSYTPAAGTVLNVAGTQTLSASFAPTDGTNYNTATASVSLTVTDKQVPVITWSNPAAITYGTELSATQLKATANTAGTFTYTPAAGTILNAGTQTLSVTFTPADTTTYTTAIKNVTLTVNKATPVITWAAPSAVYVGTALSSTQLNATANVNGTFTYTPAAGTVINIAGTQTLSASFAPTDGTNYNNASANVSLSVVTKQVPVITWSNPAAITYGTELSAAQLKATANTAGTFTYTPAAGTILNAGTQTLSVTFTPADTTTYTTATKNVSITVNPAGATVSLSGLTATYDGTAKAVAATTTPVGLSVTIAYNSGKTAVAVPTAAGSYGVTATINDPNYTGSATGTLVIAKATPVITWAAPSAVYVGTALSSTQLNATADVNGTFTYTPAAGTVMNTAGTQSLSASFAPADGTNYNTATASVSLTVTDKQVSVITWSNPAAITYGTELSATQLNAKADAAGTFTYTPAIGTVLNAGTQALSVTFTPADTTTYTTATKSVSITVNTAGVTVSLSGLSATYDGSAKAVTATTNPAGKTVAITYDGSAAVPSAAGSYSVVATVTDPNYSGSTTGTLVIAKATPVITWVAPSAVNVGTALSNTQLNATSNVDGTFAYTPAPGTVLNVAGNQTLTAAFTPTDAANYEKATASVSLTVTAVAKTTPVITWETPAAITYGTALSAIQQNAKADVAGSFTYTPAAGAVLNAGQQTLNVTFTPTDTTLYNSSTASVLLTVNKATSSVTLGGLSQIYSGTAKSATATTSPADLAVGLTYNGSTVAPIAAGSYTVVAKVDEANYTGSATGTMTIGKATPVITWTTPASVVVGTALSSTQLNAAANVAGTFGYTPPAGTVMNAEGSQTLSADFIPADTANYNNAAASVVLAVVAANTNQAPVITSQAVTTAYKDGYYYYQVLSSDPDGDAVTYSLTTRPSGMIINGTTGLIYWRPQDTGTYSVTVKVTDPDGLSASQSFRISVVSRPSNSAPKITSTAVTRATVGVLYNYDVEATDPNGDAVYFRLASAQSGMTIDAISGLISWTPSSSQTGYKYVKVEAFDSKGGKTSQSFYITVSPATATNNPPVINSTPVTSAGVGILYSYDVNASDPDDDTVTYSLVASPAGMSINSSTGFISWTPTSGQTGSFTVTVRATDSNDATDDQTYTVTVATPATDRAPAITSTAVTTAKVGTAYSYAVVANDPDGDAISYSLTTAPAGMAISTTGVITWTPTATQAGVQNVVVNATAGGQTATQSFAITVNNQAANQAPVITSQAVTTAYKDGYYYYQVLASDPDGDAVSYSLTTRPSGMTINGTTGLIYWRPEDTGTYSVTVKVTDPDGLSASQSFRISVVSRPSNNAPKITSTAVTRATVDVLYNYDVEATDPNGDAVYFRLASAQSGMTIDAISGLISWTPSSSQTGYKYVKVEAFDSKGGKTSQSFYITVSSAEGTVNGSSDNACDVNGDGAITADDIRMIVEGRGSNNLDLDVNGDGEVTLLDSRACAIQMQ